MNLISILILIFNYLLNSIIEKTSAMGHYDSRSVKEFDMIWKTTIAQFCNTSIILFTMKFMEKYRDDSEKTIWGTTGLLQ